MAGVSVFLVTHFLLYCHGTWSDNAKVEPELQNILNQGHKVNVLVSFKDGVAPALSKARGRSYRLRSEENQALVEALEEHTMASQQGVLSKIQVRSTRSGDNGFGYFKQYWTSNRLFIKEASAALISEIAEVPNVFQIKREPFGMIPRDKEDNAIMSATREKPDNLKQEILNWGVRKIKVPETWAELGGSRGEGVTVASIDSGVRHTHELLRDNFLGADNYGWYDAVEKTALPVDATGHGTNTMGILAGKRVGVAPGAKWMTCAACNSSHCPGEALLDCMQWLSCPTLPDGSNRNCSKTPQVISNSWVAERGANDFNEEILRWRELGIIPVFAVGNRGNRCNSTFSPGELPFVIGVGASIENNMHWLRSSIGLAFDGSIKPDLLAPGYATRTADFGADSWTSLELGTSMATPHVAGVIALLKVRQPELSYDSAFKLLTENADQDVWLNPREQEDYCNGSSLAKFPNLTVFPNIYAGYGLVNALKTIKAQTVLINQTG